MVEQRTMIEGMKFDVFVWIYHADLLLSAWHDSFTSTSLDPFLPYESTHRRKNGSAETQSCAAGGFALHT